MTDPVAVRDQGVPARKRRIQVPDITRCKGQSSPIVCLSVSTAPLARLADQYCDILLVGDSLGMVIYGMADTLQVTMEMMIAHGKSVTSATSRALIVVDMPFASYEASPADAFKSAARLLAETGAQAVKLEGGKEMAATIAFLSERGIPVMGHVGLMPQRKNSLGGFRTQGRNQNARDAILADVHAIATAGCFAMVVEGVTEATALVIQDASPVPTIGIGASGHCDGQILVDADILGLHDGPVAKFVRRYADIGSDIDQAFASYAGEVRARSFPAPANIQKLDS
ncbi:MAG: 3-methyl-2-oxobutanoate hydroxymethyltransferase [Pseudomonadota bacterium]